MSNLIGENTSNLIERACSLMGVSPENGDVFVVDARGQKVTGPFAMSEEKAEEYVKGLNNQVAWNVRGRRSWQGPRSNPRPFTYIVYYRS